MLKIIAGVFTVAGVGYFCVKLLSKKGDENICSNFENWTINSVASILVEKVNVSKSALVSVMEGKENSSLEAELNQIVDSVVVEFSKDSSDILVCVVVNGKDGSMVSVKKRMKWEDIPSDIREKFLRTGNASIHTEWNFAFLNKNIGDN